MQIDRSSVIGDACSCFEVASPRPPSDADATEWLRVYAEQQSSSDYDIYVVRATHPEQLLVLEIGVTANYKQAYATGTLESTETVAYSTLASSAEDCIRQCVLSERERLLGAAFDASALTCGCYLADVASSTATVTSVVTTSNTQLALYSVRVCQGVVPDSTESSFAWDATQGWCAGKVGDDGMGLRAINGTMTDGGLEFASACAAGCAGDCTMAEVVVGRWDELSGTDLFFPPPPPSPPAPPPNPPPNPPPPLFPYPPSAVSY